MQNSQKVANNYLCECCNYICSKKSDYNKHLTTTKHKSRTDLNNLELISHNHNKFICKKCDKIYNARNSLWYHEKKCKNIKNENNKNGELNKDQLILMLIKQNSELIKETNEFKNIMIEVIKNGTHNTTNNNTNSHNKSFNLQFFLNETCKDAMNIMDFVDSIKLQLSDLERIGELGYVEGISNIIVKNLNALDVTQRPVHCTDKKRETLYIKDEDKWEREDDTRAKMHKVVRKVADKNVKMLPKFKEEYPDCSKSTSKYSDQYNKIIIESMGGSGDNDYEKEEKIIKRISKEVFIDKEPSQIL